MKTINTSTKLITVFVVLILFPFFGISQNVGINDDGSAPDGSAILDVKSTDKGILIPRVDITDLSTEAPVTSPATGLMVYNTNSTTGPGFFYWDGSEWKSAQGDWRSDIADSLSAARGEWRGDIHDSVSDARTEWRGDIHDSVSDARTEWRGDISDSTFWVKYGSEIVTEDGITAVGINTSNPDNSALLDIQSTNKGVVFPRVVLDNAATAAPVTSPTAGLIIYNYGGAEDEGYYYWSGSQWNKFSKVDTSGVLTGSQIYGEMYQAYSSTGVSYPILLTSYYPWTTASQGNVTGAPYCTYLDTITGDQLVIGSHGNGVYKANINILFSASVPGVSVTFALFKNGVEVTDLLAGAYAKSKDEQFSVVITGLVELLQDDYIQLFFKTDDTMTLRLYLVNFSIDRI